MKRIFSILFSVMATMALSAQIIGHNIVVTVEPDHQDWTYKLGEKAEFTIEVRKSGTLMNDVKVDYAAGPEMYQDIKKTTTLKDGRLKLTGKLTKPGFYRVDVTAHVDGKDYKGLVERPSHLSNCNPQR